MLNNHPSHFRPSPGDSPTWTYTPLDPASPTQYINSLDSLSKSLIPNVEMFSAKETGTGGPKQSWKPKYQHMFQTLTDLTGYLTTQTYILPSGGYSGYGATGYTITSTLATPQHEELRKEIRALKGLVLSRWSSSTMTCHCWPVNSSGVGVLSPSQRFYPPQIRISNDIRYSYATNQ